jgi:hypothetical protein
VRGKKYLMVRELNVGGTSVTLRNEHGFLLRSQGSNLKTKESAQLGSNGGAR